MFLLMPLFPPRWVHLHHQGPLLIFLSPFQAVKTLCNHVIFVPHIWKNLLGIFSQRTTPIHEHGAAFHIGTHESEVTLCVYVRGDICDSPYCRLRVGFIERQTPTPIVQFVGCSVKKRFLLVAKRFTSFPKITEFRINWKQESQVGPHKS